MLLIQFFIFTALLTNVLSFSSGVLSRLGLGARAAPSTPTAAVSASVPAVAIPGGDKTATPTALSNNQAPTLSTENVKKGAKGIKKAGKEPKTNTLFSTGILAQSTKKNNEYFGGDSTVVRAGKEDEDEETKK